MKVSEVKPGIKFKFKFGEVYEVIAPIGVSSSGNSKLWYCNNDKSDIVLTEWAIIDKDVVK